MARNCEKLSISLHKEVLAKVDEMGVLENRKRSNVIETILRDHFGLKTRQRPMAVSRR